MTSIRFEGGYWDAAPRLCSCDDVVFQAESGAGSQRVRPAPADLVCCAVCGAALDDDSCDSSDRHVCRTTEL